MAEDHNVHITFEPRPPRQHRWRDIFWIIVAAALIATASGQGWLFGLVAGAGIILYLIGPHLHNNGPSDDNSDTTTA